MEYGLYFLRIVNMKQFVVLLAVLGLSLGFPSGEIENTNGTVLTYLPTIGGRIVGGTVVTIAQVPWQVALLRNSAQICGGIIIAPRVILTAAHCVVNSVIPNLNLLSFRSGSANHNSGGTTVPAFERFIHQQYSNNGMDFDIAVITLNSNINVGQATAIPLWNAGSTFASGTPGTVSGWGATCENCAGSVSLRRVEVPIVGLAQCRNAYGNSVSANMICAGVNTGGRDSCQGDSGGPFVVGGSLAGIVSWGAGCARPGLPGVYASVPAFRNWVRSISGV